MLATDRDKHLFNLYIFRTVPQKNISFIKFVKFNEYASTQRKISDPALCFPGVMIEQIGQETMTVTACSSSLWN